MAQFSRFWCPHPPVPTTHIGPLHDMNGPKSTSDKHCVIDMHHVKSLDASVSVLHHGYGAWSRHEGSFQLVWCPHLPLMTMTEGPCVLRINAQFIYRCEFNTFLYCYYPDCDWTLYFRSLRTISLLGSRRFSWYALVVTIILYILLFFIRFRGIALFPSLYLLAVACKALKKSAHPRIYDLKLFQTKYY